MPRTPINAPWTEEEIEELKLLLFKGKSLNALAVHFRKTREGVRSKLRKLGLPSPGDVASILGKQRQEPEK
jgi:hypothetical protein